MPSYVYNELLGCSDRKEPCKEFISVGFVRDAV